VQALALPLPLPLPFLLRRGSFAGKALFRALRGMGTSKAKGTSEVEPEPSSDIHNRQMQVCSHAVLNPCVPIRSKGSPPCGVRSEGPLEKPSSSESGWADGGADTSGVSGLALPVVHSTELEAAAHSIGCTFVVGCVSSAVSLLEAGSVVTGSASARAASCGGAAVSPSGATPRGSEKRVVPSRRTIWGAAKVSDRGLGSVFLKRNGRSLQADGLPDGTS